MWGPHSSLGWNKEDYVWGIVGTTEARGFINEDLASTLCQKFAAYIQPDGPLKQCQRPLALHEKEIKQQNGFYTQKQPSLPVKKECYLPPRPRWSIFPLSQLLGGNLGLRRWEVWLLQVGWQDSDSRKSWGSICYSVCSCACHLTGYGGKSIH